MITPIIKNFNELSTTKTRKDALAILEEGYRSIQTDKVIFDNIKRNGNSLIIKGKEFHLDKYERIFLFGIGKCAAEAALVLDKIVGDRITDGVIVDVQGVSLKKIRSEVGTHPLPSEKNIEIARSIKTMIEQTTEKDLILAVISGGGSALLCLPHDIKCEVLQNITESLIKAGATIEELNTVRKHLSDIQGGQFAKIAYPSEIVSIIFSDVPGNALSTIASGPTVMDKTTSEDAEAILRKYNTLALCKFPECEVIETPKEDKYFKKVSNILLLTNKTALDAMEVQAKKLGYKAEIVDERLEGEAREIGARLAREAKQKNTCLLYGGETTVTINQPGRGGRAQESALSALNNIDKHTVFIAVASDGWDNTSVAGALVDANVRERAKLLSLDPEIFLARNNSYNFFEKTGGHIVTGRTGVNVSDFYFTLTDKI